MTETKAEVEGQVVIMTLITKTAIDYETCLNQIDHFRIT